MLFFLPLRAFAAGGEINARIIQKNDIEDTDIISTSQIRHIDKLSSDNFDSTINSIINNGEIHNIVHQENEIDYSTLINVEINNLENKGSVETIIQKGITSRSNIIKN